ncbi:MAG: hypothetical protein Q8P26_04320 [Candidatus Levybacteria bacterium]|nr:hypothetical protein [Candidatus Levybacteria bacterium]
MKKYYKYGKGYFLAFRRDPSTIVTHSLPRTSYFSLVALSKPNYFFGLLLLYFIKVMSAGIGASTYLLSDLLRKRNRLK